MGTSERAAGPYRNIPAALRPFVRVPQLLLIGVLLAYRKMISPLYGSVCRFFPSCSAYALEAITVHGAIHGSWLAGRRLLRCHPWNAGGVDHVPAGSVSFDDPETTPYIIQLNHPDRFLPLREAAREADSALRSIETNA